MRNHLIPLALLLGSTALSGCSYFSCTYSEISPEEFTRRTTSIYPESLPLPIEYRGSDKKFAYFEFDQFLGMCDRLKVKKEFVGGSFYFGKFPWVSGVYYPRNHNMQLAPIFGQGFGNPNNAIVVSGKPTETQSELKDGILKQGSGQYSISDDGKVIFAPIIETPKFDADSPDVGEKKIIVPEDKGAR